MALEPLDPPSCGEAQDDARLVRDRGADLIRTDGNASDVAWGESLGLVAEARGRRGREARPPTPALVPTPLFGSGVRENQKAPSRLGGPHPSLGPSRPRQGRGSGTGLALLRLSAQA